MGQGLVAIILASSILIGEGRAAAPGQERAAKKPRAPLAARGLTSIDWTSIEGTSIRSMAG